VVGYETLTYERKDHVAYIMMNRPERHNAFNDTMAREFIEVFREFDADDDAWVAIFAGNGRSFCSGADVRERQAQPQEVLRKRGGPGGRIGVIGDSLGLGDTINWKPVIAAVHGYAVGGGCDIAMQCDLVVATADAQFEVTEVRRGLPSSHLWSSLWFWGGARIANELVLTGRRFSGEEAARLGMVNRLASSATAIEEAEALANELLRLPPLAVRANVRMCRYYVRELARASTIYQSGLKLYLSEDYQESVRATLEKRDPAPYRAR
jgi:enoyl-CoA hydratase/carnithine racemase